mmetsp:Transcript_15327/g.29585  ORF Transcript_15327/g.29585 Transcript_15327/m.29585 type:complete len:345 (+) Transcript_15327:191-1225(+)|eukprot:CAMPEP_0197479868 /NCGR_PEP_ID=MMETSP1309-20131121/36998_1 /TAXON_ID=464262 /ORGANISM="Genus nov. species nov., Strain RCC998" /LENGTH=344 /DNA_ID=CAMNT_0043021655 /DNA_START=111 /DNA_END=1145 /DNA_ORIENTATION=-
MAMDPWSSSGSGINGGITSGDMGGPGLQNATRSDLPAIMNGDFGKAFEQSFKEFAQRPENKVLLEKHQRKEFKKAARLSRKSNYAEFQDKVLSADYDAQKNIAPFLENRVLRRVINTFCNDPNNDFSKWANNKEVLNLLHAAKKMMDEGRMSEDEAEELMYQVVSSPDREWHHEWKLKSKQCVRLPTDQLMGALNEHLEERRKGNDLYRQRKFNDALKQYERALGIVELVVGMSGFDQKEIDKNRISSYLNIAAVHLAQRNLGECIKFCSKAIELDECNIKGLLRRAKAYTLRHEYKSAKQDLERVKDLEPWNAEAEEDLRRLAKVLQKSMEEQKRIYSGLFQH